MYLMLTSISTSHVEGDPNTPGPESTLLTLKVEMTVYISGDEMASLQFDGGTISGTSTTSEGYFI